MKLKYKLIVFASVFTVLFASCISVFAEPDDPVVTEAPIATEAPVETEPPIVTEAPTDPPTQAPQTEAPTEAPQTQAPQTEAPQTQAPQTEAPQTEAPQTEAPTQAKPTEHNDYEDLPSAPVDEEPTAVNIDNGENGDLTYGIASWACVIVGVLTIVIIIISNKSHNRGGIGKQRYDEGDKITGQKRLLNDDYYNTRKFNVYHNKDTRK